jgi:hydrogenase/urease accessory protein HupE
MPYLRGTRRRPGSLFLIALGLLCLAARPLVAHDPGLSSLEIRMGGRGVASSVSIAASDVALIVPQGVEGRPILTEIAREAVRIAVDGAPLTPVVDEVSLDDGAARVQLSFVLAQSLDSASRLTIASDVPKRLSRGHRQLMVVSLDDRVLTERLLDETSGEVTVDLEPGSPSAAARDAQSSFGRFRLGALRFLELGVRHILSGYDHLMFLAGLLLAARTARETLLALTAFTAAHSLSLALVVLAGAHLPPAIVEPAIAASIAWVGLESLRRRQAGVRWVVVFGFGLIHGFGFAEALIELRFGSSAVETATALLSFNAGVEAGQVAVAAVLLPIMWAIRTHPAVAARLLPLCSTAIVIAGGYWLVERLR